MATGPTDIPTDAIAGDVEAGAADAFGLLADETRLAILLVLWTAYDPTAEDNAVPFSEIFDRVDYDSAGNFNYHLQQLEGQFIDQPGEGEGYRIRTTGLKFVRSILAGAGVRDVTLEPTEIAHPCPFCDAPTTVSYRDGAVRHTCTTCAGSAPADADDEGLLSVVPFDPAGVRERTAEEVWAASTVAALRSARSLYEGLCPACSGAVDGWFECPDGADAGGDDDEDGSAPRPSVRAHFRCRTCRNHKIEPPRGLALFHPAMVSFHREHGGSTHVRADDPASVARYYELVDGHEVEIVSDTPRRVAVTAAYGDDTLRLTFDDTVRVIDVTR